MAVEVFQSCEMTADSAWRGTDSNRVPGEAYRQVSVPGESQVVLQGGRTINHSMWMRCVLQ